MRAKLITMAVYIGLGLLMFSCVQEQTEFYEKEVTELERSLKDHSLETDEEFASRTEEERDDESLDDGDIFAIHDNVLNTDIVIVYNDGDNANIDVENNFFDDVTINHNTNNTYDTDANETEDIVDIQDGEADVSTEIIQASPSGSNESEDINSDSTSGSGTDSNTDSNSDSNTDSSTESTTESDSGPNTDEGSGSHSEIANSDSNVESNQSNQSNQTPEVETENETNTEPEREVSEVQGSEDNSNQSDGPGDDEIPDELFGKSNGEEGKDNSKEEGSESEQSETTEQNSTDVASEDNGSHTENNGTTNAPTVDTQEEEEVPPVVVVEEQNKDFVNEVEDSLEEDKFICDPFDGENQTSFQGIAGFVYDGLQHPFRDVQDYYDFGAKSDTPIFLSEVNVPTRRFSEGFELNDGAFVLNDMGGKLFEYFALDLRGQIRLGQEEESGHYQFAILSDDGSIFEIDINGEQKELINNNRNTPTRMKCAAEPVYFDQNTQKPFQLKYFQGPRMHISLMLLWRKVDPNNIPEEKMCDRAGNGLFFDSNIVPSKPKSVYTAMLNRGWKVLDSQNFRLPSGISENPCGDDKQVAEAKCYSEQVVMDGRNWFNFDGNGVDLQSIKIEDETGKERSHHYLESRERIRIGGRCLRGHKFRISYCEEK